MFGSSKQAFSKHHCLQSSKVYRQLMGLRHGELVQPFITQKCAPLTLSLWHMAVDNVWSMYNSAFHLSGVSKWVPALAGKAKAGMIRILKDLTVLPKHPLRTRAIPERLGGVITTRCYTNPHLPLPYTYLYQYIQNLLQSTVLEAANLCRPVTVKGSVRYDTQFQNLSAWWAPRQKRGELKQQQSETAHVRQGLWFA